MVGDRSNKTKLAYIPTAANVESGSKDWLIADLNNFEKRGYEVDIVDISAVPKDIWLPRLEESKVIVLGGGNTFHLMYWIQKSGIDKELKELLKSRVYVGISAGSMVATKRMLLSQSAKLYSESIGELDNDTALGYVDFLVRPHFNSPYFPYITHDHLAGVAKDTPYTFYALDDDSSIAIEDGKLEIVSEGVYEKFN